MAQAYSRDRIRAPAVCSIWIPRHSKDRRQSSRAAGNAGDREGGCTLYRRVAVSTLTDFLAMDPPYEFPREVVRYIFSWNSRTAFEGRMNRFRIGTVLLTCISAITAGAESAPAIQGTASIIDGEPSRHERIRLDAIDAPESS
jgi:hypothetical protein